MDKETLDYIVAEAELTGFTIKTDLNDFIGYWDRKGLCMIIVSTELKCYMRVHMECVPVVRFVDGFPKKRM